MPNLLMVARLSITRSSIRYIQSSRSTWYTVPGFEQDDNWWLFDVGVSRDFGKVTGFLTGNASASKGDGNYWGLTLGIRVPL